MRRFQSLRVYQEALKLSVFARTLSRKFPRDEIFGLTTQFRRAADSIALNIAEGAGNSSNREFARYLEIAGRSAQECVSCLDIALSNGYLGDAEARSAADQYDKVIAMLVLLRRHLRP